jgi:hypothetical protein
MTGPKREFPHRSEFTELGVKRVKLKELQDVAHEARLMINLCSLQIRRHRCETPEELQQLLWTIGDVTVLHDELQEHLDTLELILEVCAAVAKGRYLEDYQRGCIRLESPCRHDCTSSEHCDGFDDRLPHTVIADALAELEPFSEALRGWILAQLELQRSRREVMRGKDGLFGGATVVMHTQNEDGVLVPMSEEAAAAAMAQHDAQQDAENESMGLRIDQYALNLQRMQQICHAKGDPQEIVALITEGMPPQVRPAIISS